MSDAEKDEIARLTREVDRQRKRADHNANLWHKADDRLRAEQKSHVSSATAAEARATELEGQVAALVEGLRKIAGRDDDDIHTGEQHADCRNIARSLLARIQPALSGQEAGR